MSAKLFKLIGIFTAVVLAGVSGMLICDTIHSHARENLQDAKECVFIIPPEYIPGGKTGLFINKDNPMESSSISYNVYYNEKDKVMTNREAAEYIASGKADVVDESLALTKDIYENNMIGAYDKEYGENVNYSVSSFDKISIDGYPGFKIDSSYSPSGGSQIYQTVYMIISKYRTFTITFQRAADDECEQFFEESAATIHIR